MRSSGNTFSAILDSLLAQEYSPKIQATKDSLDPVPPNLGCDPLNDVNLFIRQYSQNRPKNCEFAHGTANPRLKYNIGLNSKRQNAGTSKASPKAEMPHSPKDPRADRELKPSLSPRQLASLYFFIRLGAEEIHEGSTPAEIKKAFRKLVKQWHPDSAPKASSLAREQMTETFFALREAYEALTHPNKIN